jgi:hypothetical protein
MTVVHRVPCERPLRVLLVSGGDATGDRAVTSPCSGDSTHTFTTQPYRALDLAGLEGAGPRGAERPARCARRTARALGGLRLAGGSIAVFPPSQGDARRYAELFGAMGAAAPTRMDTGTVRVDRIDLEEPFYRAIFQTMPRNVELPVVRERWNDAPGRGQRCAAALAGWFSPYPRAQHARQGHPSTSALRPGGKRSNLTRHSLFATSLLRMAELSRPMGALYHTIGDEASIPLEHRHHPPTSRRI